MLLTQIFHLVLFSLSRGRVKPRALRAIVHSDIIPATGICTCAQAQIRKFKDCVSPILIVFTSCSCGTGYECARHIGVAGCRACEHSVV